MVYLMVIMCMIIVCLFLFIKNPMGVGVLLFLLSLTMVIKMGFLMSTWYAYMLFLVYVGGLLVMFIYICMISSNYRLVSGFSLWSSVSVGLAMLFVSQFVINQKLVIFWGLGVNGLYLPLFLFLALGAYLLICFLAIINIIFSGGVTMKVESS